MDVSVVDTDSEESSGFSLRQNGVREVMKARLLGRQ
jgi:hypothetical protein